MSLWFAAAAMLCWGISDVTIKSLTNKYDALTTTVYKFIPHAMLLAVFFIFSGPILPPDTVTWGLIMAFGVIGAVALYAFVTAISRGMVSLAVALAHINAIITAVLSAIFLDEVLGGLHYLAIFAIVAGVFLITADLRSMKLKKVKGLKMALVTALGWGIIYVLLKAIVGRMDAVAAAFYTDTVVVTLIVLLFLMTNGPFKLPRKKDALLISGSAFASAAAAAFTAVSFTYSKVSIAMGIIAAAPMITFVLAIIFLKEKVNVQQGLGIVVITGGLVLISVLG